MSLTDKIIIGIIILTALPLVILAFIKSNELLINIGTGIMFLGGLYFIVSGKKRRKQG